MGPIDMTRPLIACAILGVFFGLLIALGLPWMWDALIKPFLVWLVQ